ncbi:EAL domain, c-di-GMP-specific phosphodiesterase class I (or its enzymatically inactive variant) [Cryptosporangium aurantiacum]|uniref:EAL domain, c-di-GMP-specific phosphodiesterase class I (Or its enzymatically inactive variant) n=1 Tax=Cryptosporangium aurantiacum TaxID=134849 RepID=A0A1M7R6V4_9ACTN|nr:EAL domain, c-di-GMP-specific phosphodiesterase class I (or its enzymatically inactive variant) [Cryptosporangium aurantiacum]
MIPVGQVDGRAVTIAVFSWEWARNLSGTSWVPDDRTVIAERLRRLAEEAADALLGHAEPSSTGRAIGEGVVAIGFAAPDALGRTLHLLAERLPADLGIEPVDGSAPALLAAVGVGFARAAHDRTLAQQDAIRSSDLVARQRAERALQAQLAGASGLPVGRTGRPIDTRFREELPTALDRGEVVPYYQPIVALDDERVLGFEALARWEHPTRGTLPPSVFLPTAADADLFRTLGRRLREDACRAAVRWQSEAGRPVFVGVNLSPAELSDPRLTDDVRGLLERTGLDPALLHLEITEDVVLGDADLPLLRGLAATGVTLVLDDFGTGLSRLSMLPTLPVHGLKLAGALLDPVRQLPFSAAQAGIEVLGAVTALAGQLGLTTTVEGVENAAEAGLARRLGIPRAQGWHYGHPLPAADVR